MTNRTYLKTGKAKFCLQLEVQDIMSRKSRLQGHGIGVHTASIVRRKQWSGGKHKEGEEMRE